MFDFFARLFRSEPSGATAKERLRLVLLSDHLALAPDVVESLKTDLLEVISRYVEVDTQHVDVTFEQREHEVAMLANVPILSMKAPHERQTVTPPAVVQLPNPPAPLSIAPPEPAATAGFEAPGTEGPACDDEAAPVTDAVESAPPAQPDAVMLMLPSGDGATPRLPRSRRRRRRKASANGVPAQQANSGVATPTPL